MGAMLLLQASRPSSTQHRAHGAFLQFPSF